MLIKATIEDIKKYGEFAYSLALNPSKTCYPIYYDGRKTKDDFLAAAKRALSTDTSEILLFSIDGNVEGWISYFWILEDRYLQLNGFNINCGTEQALTEFVHMMEAKFAGYMAYFGYPDDNHEASNFLAEHGFKCIERNWHHTFFFDGYRVEEYSSCVERIFRQNFDEFRGVYHADSDTYWNADRIFERIDDWIIFVYKQAGTPVATIFLTGDDDGHYEIYGTEFQDGGFQERSFRDLLTASLGECKRLGAKYMTYFCGEDEKSVLSEFGFKCVGQYVLYRKTI